jgi:hypothetical protein
VLIDTQHLRTAGGVPLAKLALESALKVALHGGRPDSFSPAQPATIDSIQVMAKDHSLKGVTGSLARQDPWKPLAEISTATLALEFAGFQLQNTMPQPPVLMPHSPWVAAFVAQPLAPAVRARFSARYAGQKSSPHHR